MSDFQIKLWVCGLIVVFLGALDIWKKFNKKSSGKNNAAANNTAATEQFRKRQCSPDFEAFQKHFGCEPPQALKKLFSEPELFTDDKDMFEIAVPSEAGQEKRWFLAWIDALDEEHLKSSRWPGTENLYAFANNGAGDEYLIDPKQKDPEVIYYEHETRKMKSVGVTLSQFVSAKRIYDEE
jgi:SMI1/KNR4 family protein SUKH-1